MKMKVLIICLILFSNKKNEDLIYEDSNTYDLYIDNGFSRRVVCRFMTKEFIGLDENLK